MKAQVNFPRAVIPNYVYGIKHVISNEGIYESTGLSKGIRLVTLANKAEEYTTLWVENGKVETLSNDSEGNMYFGVGFRETNEEMSVIFS